MNAMKGIEKIIQDEIKRLYRKNFRQYVSRNNNGFILILGGLGPEASVDLERKIIDITPAEKDQDNFRILHFSNPWLPDRTRAYNELKKNNPGPARELIRETVRAIQALLNFSECDCSLVAIPCSSIYCFLHDVSSNGSRIRGINYYLKRNNVQRRILNTIEETATFAKEYLSDVKRFGLLATSSTLEQELYDEAFGKLDKRIFKPRREIQDNCVTPAIELIKGKEKRAAGRLLSRAVAHLEQRGAEMIILGCSELSLILKGQKYVDTNLILAFSTVRKTLS
jgi:aspartate racemase